MRQIVTLISSVCTARWQVATTPCMCSGPELLGKPVLRWVCVMERMSNLVLVLVLVLLLLLLLLPLRFKDSCDVL